MPASLTLRPQNLELPPDHGAEGRGIRWRRFGTRSLNALAQFGSRQNFTLRA